MQDRPNWTSPRLRARANRHGDFAEIEARTGVRVSQGHLSVLLREKGGSRWRRPRHSLTGRQDAREVERAGLRLQLRRAQAEAGDVVLLYGDESEALTPPLPGPCLGRAGRRPARSGAGAGAQGGPARRAGRPHARGAGAYTSATKRNSDFAALLDLLDRRYGPQPGQTRQPVVLVLDNGPIHTSKASLAAFAARSAWLTVEWLPRYAPELNPIGNTWRDLKRHHLAHQTFRDMDELDRAIHQAMAELNKERSHMHPCHNLPMAA